MSITSQRGIMICLPTDAMIALLEAPYTLIAQVSPVLE